MNETIRHETDYSVKDSLHEAFVMACPELAADLAVLVENGRPQSEIETVIYRVTREGLTRAAALCEVEWLFERKEQQRSHPRTGIVS